MDDFPDVLNRIATDPMICGGEPCIAGTSLTVTYVAQLAERYSSRVDLLNDYPELDEECINQACIYMSMDTLDRLAYASPSKLLALLSV